MEFVFLGGAFLNFIVGCYFVYVSFSCWKTERLKRISVLFLLFSVAFFVATLFFCFWLFGISSFSFFDYSFISFILVFFRTVLLLILLFFVFSNRAFVYFLLFFVSSIFSFFLQVPFGDVLFITSFLLVLLVSLIVFSKKGFERAAFFGILYSFVICILFSLLFLGIGNIFFLGFVETVLFFVFLFFLIRVIRKDSNIILTRGFFEENSSFFMDFLKYFVFIVVLTNFIFISTITFHELGHFGVSKILDCSYSKIVYERGLPHTEILCQNDDVMSYRYAIFGGIFGPLLLSLLFFFSGGRFIREIGLLIVGFNSIISYKDLMDLGFSDTFSLFFTVVGGFVIIFAIGSLAGSRVEESEFLDFVKSNLKKGNGEKLDGEVERDKSFYKAKAK